MKRPFPISSHKAAILKRSNRLGVSGWDISDGDYAPFTPVWPSRRVVSEKTRFTLPALAFKARSWPSSATATRTGLRDVPQALLVHAVIGELRKNPDVQFGLSGTEARGSLEIVLRGDGAFSYLVGSYSWNMPDDIRYACTVSAQAPLTSADMIRFAGACVENHLRGIEAEQEIDVSQLEDDIRGTDFGY